MINSLSITEEIISSSFLNTGSRSPWGRDRPILRVSGEPQSDWCSQHLPRVLVSRRQTGLPCTHHQSARRGLYLKRSLLSRLFFITRTKNKDTFVFWVIFKIKRRILCLWKSLRLNKAVYTVLLFFFMDTFFDSWSIHNLRIFIFCGFKI